MPVELIGWIAPPGLFGDHSRPRACLQCRRRCGDGAYSWGRGLRPGADRLFLGRAGRLHPRRVCRSCDGMSRCWPIVWDSLRPRSRRGSSQPSTSCAGAGSPYTSSPAAAKRNRRWTAIMSIMVAATAKARNTWKSFDESGRRVHPLTTRASSKKSNAPIRM